MDIFEMLLRAVLIYAVLLIMARLNGAKQIAQMSFYDYVSGITVGSLAATISINNSVSFFTGLGAIIFYLGASLLLNKITQKDLQLSNLLTGEPVILIQRGEIQWDNMKKSKLTLGELLSNLRTAGYFNINEVYQAILETSGNLSVLAKGYARTVQTSDFQLKAADPVLVTEVIIDGEILPMNLKSFGKDTEWLMKQLKKQDRNLEDIALAILDEKGMLDLYEKRGHSNA